MDYIHYNPVKHGYVQAAKDWPFSTFQKYVQQGIYPEDWGGVAQNFDLRVGWTFYARLITDKC